MVYVVTYLRAATDGWPVDVGDDPSFVSSARVGGDVTWGVCRPDVRRALRPGDAVVFFAADRLRDRRPARYQFVGCATVDRCVRQTDVWTEPGLATFRTYGNLLTRPIKGGYEHHEELPRHRWHDDWLWRISETKSLRKAAFTGRERFSAADRVDGRVLRIAPNYVIFRPEPTETFIIADPPVVATVNHTGRTERWLTSRFASKLRSLVLGSTGRHLRTTNPQIAHRHIVVEQEAEPLLRQLRQLCIDSGFGMRRTERQIMSVRTVETLSRRRSGC